MDVNNVFFYGDLLEYIYIYMEQSPRYAIQGEYHLCKLKKVIYSLKQSSCTWFDKFIEIIASIAKSQMFII